MEPLSAMNPDQSCSEGKGRAAWRTLAVLAGVALALRAGDAIPGWISAVPRGVHLCASVSEAEAITGLRLDKVGKSLAGYAARDIRATARPITAIAMAMQGGDDKSQLTLFRSLGGDIPTTLRPPQPSFHELTVPLGPGLSASLKAERYADGSVWQDLDWSDGTLRTGLRFNGRTVELLRLARQIAGDVP
ncbi:MAG TPA: hypothetical protein VIM14_18545 [Polyangia bacterium]